MANSSTGAVFKAFSCHEARQRWCLPYLHSVKTAAKYGELVKYPKRPSYDELVKISIYDMGGGKPKLLTSTWGGANSKQAYGPGGGADRVDVIGQPGIELWLHKAVCVKAEDLAKRK